MAVEIELPSNPIHPELFSNLQAPTLTWIDGELVSDYGKDPTPKTSYTLTDLTRYFYQRTAMAKRKQQQKRDEGGFRYLLERSELEVLLFAIDLASATVDQNEINSALDLQYYLDDAELLYEQKRMMSGA